MYMTIQNKLFGENPSLQDFEQLLWKAADILRGAVRPEHYSPPVVLQEAFRMRRSNE
jgi:hypothetical protein